MRDTPKMKSCLVAVCVHAHKFMRRVMYAHIQITNSMVTSAMQDAASHMLIGKGCRRPEGYNAHALQRTETGILSPVMCCVCMQYSPTAYKEADHNQRGDKHKAAQV